MEPKTVLTIASFLAKGIEILLKKDDDGELEASRHAEIMSALADLNLRASEIQQNIKDIYRRIGYIPGITADTINLNILQGYVGQYQRLIQYYFDKGLSDQLKTRFSLLLDKIQSSTEYIDTNNTMNPVFVFVMSSAMKADITITKIYDPDHVEYVKDMYLEYFTRILIEGVSDDNSYPPIQSSLASERDRIEPYLTSQTKEIKRTIDVVNWDPLKRSIRENHQEAEAVPYVESTFKVELQYQESDEIERLLSLGIIKENERYTSFKQTLTEKYCEWYHLRSQVLAETARYKGINNFPLKRYEVTHAANINRRFSEIDSEYKSVIPLTNLYLLASAEFVASKSIEFLNRQ